MKSKLNLFIQYMAENIAAVKGCLFYEFPEICPDTGICPVGNYPDKKKRYPIYIWADSAAPYPSISTQSPP